jgi:hypothetical protein
MAVTTYFMFIRPKMRADVKSVPGVETSLESLLPGDVEPIS